MQTVTMSGRHVCSCLQASADMFVLVCSVYASHLPTGWPHDHGPTYVGAMVKKECMNLVTSLQSQILIRNIPFLGDRWSIWSVHILALIPICKYSKPFQNSGGGDKHKHRHTHSKILQIIDLTGLGASSVTHRQTDIATTRLTQPRGRVSEKSSLESCWLNKPIFF